jgi:hypothetical protein
MAYERRGRDFWSRHLGAQERSGLSMRAYCEEQGLSMSTFQLWKRRIRSEGVDAPAFAEVEFPQAALVPFCVPDLLEVRFPSGATMRLHSPGERILQGLVKELLRS